MKSLQAISFVQRFSTNYLVRTTCWGSCSLNVHYMKQILVSAPYICSFQNIVLFFSAKVTILVRNPVLVNDCNRHMYALCLPRHSTLLRGSGTPGCSQGSFFWDPKRGEGVTGGFAFKKNIGHLSFQWVMIGPVYLLDLFHQCSRCSRRLVLVYLLL